MDWIKHLNRKINCFKLALICLFFLSSCNETSTSNKKDIKMPIISIGQRFYLDFNLSIDSVSAKNGIKVNYLDYSDYQTFYYDSDSVCKNIWLGKFKMDSIGYILIEKENRIIGFCVFDKDYSNFNLNRVKLINGKEIEFFQNKEYGYTIIYPLGNEFFIDCLPPLTYNNYPFWF